MKTKHRLLGEDEPIVQLPFSNDWVGMRESKALTVPWLILPCLSFLGFFLLEAATMGEDERFFRCVTRAILLFQPVSHVLLHDNIPVLLINFWLMCSSFAIITYLDGRYLQVLSLSAALVWFVGLISGTKYSSGAACLSAGLIAHSHVVVMHHGPFLKNRNPIVRQQLDSSSGLIILAGVVFACASINPIEAVIVNVGIPACVLGIYSSLILETEAEVLERYRVLHPGLPMTVATRPTQEEKDLLDALMEKASYRGSLYSVTVLVLAIVFQAVALFLLVTIPPLRPRSTYVRSFVHSFIM